MPNVQDIQIGELIKLLVIGPYKSGKTAGALTFPRPNVMDFDHGVKVARNPWWVAKYGKRSIEYQEFSEKNKTPQGVVTSHNAFDDACRYFDEWMKPGKRDQFDTWVIDSMTTLSDFASNKAIVLLGGTSFGKPLSFTHDQAKKTGLVVPKQQDFGAERSMVEQFTDMLLDSNKHVVFIAHESPIYDNSDNIIGYGPMLTGKSKETVPLKFDEVYHLQVKKVGPETKRVLHTQADGIYRCGSRIGIPDNTPWDYDSLKAEIDKIKAATK